MSDFDCLLRLGIEKVADPLTPAALSTAAAETHTNPSDAQKDTGNYRKGRAKWHGLELVIENPKGSTRSGTGADGKTWSTKMRDHYGYIGKTKSKADGDGIDFFLNDEHLGSEIIFVVNQKSADGTFDEHKCVLGCHNLEDAKKTYLRNYAAGWTGMGEVTPITLDHFKWWMANADTSKEIKNGYFAAMENRKQRTKTAADPITGAYSDPDEKETFDRHAEEAEDEEELKKILDKKDYLSRYKCPHCGGSNLLNGDPKSGMRFRGSGHCQDCDKGCSIVGSGLKPIGQGPELVMSDESIERWRKTRRWERRMKAREKEAEYVPAMFLVKRAADDDQPFTIAVDLDGTLAEKEEPFDPESIGSPIEAAIDYVKQFKKAGARIIIFTVRGDTAMVEKWLDDNEVPYDFVNHNPDQPEDSSGKVIADVYWDDRAYNAKDPHEYGPEILRRVTDDEGDIDQSSGPVMMVQRTTTTIMIHPHSVLAGLTEQHHDDEAE